MKHTGTINISTERLQLRRFYKEDADDCFNNWMVDEEVYEFLSASPKDRKYIEEWLSCADEVYAKNDTYYWAIVEKESGKTVGEIFVNDYSEKNRVAELWWTVGPRFKGKGYATEAAKAIVSHLFNEVGFHRVWAKCVDGNIGSERVMQKCGMEKEGIMREYFYDDKTGEYKDLVVYSVINQTHRG